MHFGHLHFLPLALFLLFLFTFATTYVISVLNKDVEPIFPYISDTGTFIPTSCIFGQLLNVGSILLSFIVYIKYKQVDTLDETFQYRNVSNLNASGLFLGWLSALGIGIVANFQETSVFSVHLIGAIMAFGLLSVYQLLVWRINGKLRKELEISNAKLYWQLILGVVSMITFFSCFGFAMIALNQFTGKDMTKWKSSDGGYQFHLVSTITEWICSISSIIYVLTFIPEFKKIRIYEPEIKFVN